ncbi:uncharacterized protein LOC118279165 [Spodoptera frugiperda]|uniref:Uncharacterized protein LOC118279165 n=1 Tax=Spodoptera frugiperda TaxID=7108 RepID=A0A9R0DII6_SPOFR|nr:uncharacterized protein LOC118279165 [Spodoptera frugiperda]
MYSKVLVTLFVLYLSTVECNDIHIGYTNTRSRKVYSELKEADPALWRRTDEVTIKTPPHEVIDSIHVSDLREEKDGEAYITSGGVGMPYVTIALKSPTILRGYKFQIEVYASSTASNEGLFSKSPYFGDVQQQQVSRKF